MKQKFQFPPFPNYPDLEICRDSSCKCVSFGCNPLATLSQHLSWFLQGSGTRYDKLPILATSPNWDGQVTFLCLGLTFCSFRNGSSTKKNMYQKQKGLFLIIAVRNVLSRPLRVVVCLRKGIVMPLPAHRPHFVPPADRLVWRYRRGSPPRLGRT